MAKMQHESEFPLVKQINKEWSEESPFVPKLFHDLRMEERPWRVACEAPSEDSKEFISRYNAEDNATPTFQTQSEMFLTRNDECTTLWDDNADEEISLFNSSSLHGDVGNDGAGIDFIDAAFIEDNHNVKTKCDSPMSMEIFAGKISRKENKMWVCNICSQESKGLVRMKQHVKRHFSHLKYQCTECLASFKNADDLSLHAVSHTTSCLVLGHTCKQCYKSFYLKHLLDKHVSAVHTPLSDCEPTSRKFHETCGKCVRVFHSSLEMENHNESCDEGLNNPENSSEDENPHAKSSVRKTIIRRMECYMCHLSFNSSAQLFYHCEKEHKGEKPLKCSEPGCEKKYSSVSLLRMHKIIHRPKKFECDICKKKFHTKQLVAAHISSHYDEKPFQCEECGKRFSLKSYLAKHSFIHGEKLFKCTECDMAFCKRGDLNGHMYVHKTVPECVCEICGNSYFRPDSLRQHKREKHSTTEQYQCKHCGQKFMYLSTCKRHRKKCALVR